MAGVQPEPAAEGLLALKIPPELRPQEIHHHRPGHRAVLFLHAVVHKTLGGAAAPAGLDALLGVAAEVEPIPLLLGIAEHLLPVEIHDPVTAADVVVHMAVDGLVVIHAAAYQNLGLFPGEVFQPLWVQQLADLGGIAPLFQFQLEQKITLVFPHRVFVQDQKVETHRRSFFVWAFRPAG